MLARQRMTVGAVKYLVRFKIHKVWHQSRFFIGNPVQEQNFLVARWKNSHSIARQPAFKISQDCMSLSALYLHCNYPWTNAHLRVPDSVVRRGEKLQRRSPRQAAINSKQLQQILSRSIAIVLKPQLSDPDLRAIQDATNSYQKPTNLGGTLVYGGEGVGAGRQR